MLQYKHNTSCRLDLTEVYDIGPTNEKEQEEYRDVIGAMDEDVGIITTPDGETEKDCNQVNLLDTNMDQLHFDECAFDWSKKRIRD